MPGATRVPRLTIGVLAGWQYYWTPTPLSYLDPIFRGIRLAAQELGCNLLLGCGMGSSAAATDPLRPAWPVESPETDFVPIGPWNTDGLIIVNPLRSEHRSHYVQEVRASGHPLIFVGAGEEGPAIAADNRAGILAALEHLIDHGHRSIAFIAGSTDDMAGDTGDRLRAYQEGIAEYGLTADDRLVAYGKHVFGGGEAAMRQLLATGVPFSAVLASNDESAFGAIQALQSAGRRIPDDVAIIGFDDRLESSVQRPSVTSVQIPLFEMGYRALDMLWQRITYSQEEGGCKRVPVRLVTRESCGCGQTDVIADVGEVDSIRILNAETPIVDHFVQEMASCILAETQGLDEDEVEGLCHQLILAFLESIQTQDPASFQKTLISILDRAAIGRDNSHVWQTALSLLWIELPDLLQAYDLGMSLESGYTILDQARVTISAAMRQRQRLYRVEQRWSSNRMGILTAQLLSALDENQVYDLLARHLPDLGIHTAWVALYESENEDAVACSLLRDVMSPQQSSVRIHSRTFPPDSWVSADQPFRLALIPLRGLHGRAGFMVFDAVHLDLQGAIAQQTSAALQTAQLYREATEGRRLAEEANQIKSRFLSTVSHELQTPLNLIVGVSGLLLQESDDLGSELPDQLRQDIERIHANARHLGRLIGDVLDLASTDAGQLRLTYEFVDLGQTMQMVAETGQQLAVEKGLTWQASVPDSGPWVWGDRTRLRQVALNLISNAVKFTAEGVISLSIETDSDAVTVSVRDTGLGLPLGEQQAIFDEFRRSQRTIDLGYSGMGLGLAISKRLVTMHGGMIGVRSQGQEGSGSVFYFTLPTVAAPMTKGSPGTHHGVDRQQVLILSSWPGGKRLHEHLRHRGFAAEITPVDDSVAWLSNLLGGSFSAVIIDVTQAPEHGWRALKILKNNPATQHLPTLFFASTAESGIVRELDYLTKPIEISEFTRALDQHWLIANTPSQARTFLVVDDDASTLDLHARIIKSHAQTNRVLSARNGREALDIMQQASVDLVLLDLMMPEMDGFAVLEAMNDDERLRNTPVIVMTGQVLSEAEMARLNHGVITVMQKGMFDLEETLSHLEAALGRQHKLSDEAQRLMRKAMSYMHLHYSEQISRHDLAEHVGMNEDYFTYCFRQESGMTPIAYLNRYRVMRAKQYLTESDKSITAIAFDVGFSSSGYFSRVFRREVGMSPDAYRRQHEL